MKCKFQSRKVKLFRSWLTLRRYSISMRWCVSVTSIESVPVVRFSGSSSGSLLMLPKELSPGESSNRFPLCSLSSSIRLSRFSLRSRKRLLRFTDEEFVDIVDDRSLLWMLRMSSCEGRSSSMQVESLRRSDEREFGMESNESSTFLRFVLNYNEKNTKYLKCLNRVYQKKSLSEKEFIRKT